MKKLFTYTLLTFAVLSFQEAKAQFSTSKAPIKIGQRFEVGIDVRVQGYTYVHEFHGQMPFGHSGRMIPYSEVFSQNRVSYAGGAHIGTRVPLFKVSNNSILAFSIEAGYLVNTFFAVNYRFFNEPASMDQINVGTFYAPIGIEFKTGADAMLDKSLKTGFTLGAGVAPTFVHFSHPNAPYSNSYYTPFVKGEVAFGKHEFFKLRMLASFGKIDFYNSYGESYRYNAEEDANRDVNFARIESKANFMVSFVRLMGSKKWGNNF